ncbi:CRISPR-associated helicase Cas3, subtype I-F/YPEST [Alishewanella aestuarii B11]|uniref:CRISPR-associated helicase Cas3, subtype I-F/YPEST n=1 Tax=Alishewanella aestuarii B11 TaxID=1197174 RepID=J1YAQ6_9ALTE|nr:type I-F CRISPR-associated helicase Cas3f [Alishewanella aestuarii]EJI84875.1 CRISPR-associated helicase Cas3, subtype I-F/YPEST [Alishewanella aestuarii B11]
MNIMLVSQCSKNALIETRRIIDQFAERRGDRTWQTPITLQGLDVLRKLLKKSARRNTAVACHWIRSKNHTELLWVVGNQRKFNVDGATPTNMTLRNILRSEDENSWHNAEVIALLAGIAGLFHDFGKANLLFQQKINPKVKTPGYEPYRHEWVSLRLFQAFTAGKSDKQWLTELANITAQFEHSVLAKLHKDAPEQGHLEPFAGLAPVARLVAWLIVSHHRLPIFPDKKSDTKPVFENINSWLNNFDVLWNSVNSAESCEQQRREQNWFFVYGSPLLSATWRQKAGEIAARALNCSRLFEQDWFEQRFTSHNARMVLMLADHYYSAQEPKTKWQDASYKAFANSYRENGELKQKLDEHNIGVSHNAYLLARSLPTLKNTLPAITRHKGFKQRAKLDKFRWQDKAYDLACSVRENSVSQGFFGINMASTGKGKTFANARIMYGLADEKLGCRFSVALGLRTLTLQTGDALKQRLQLTDDDLAVLIGSAAVQQLHDISKQALQAELAVSSSATGSESLVDPIAEHLYVSYEGSLYDGRLKDWLNSSPKLNQLVSAPVLVSTIDHLMPATEGVRGGKQIAPMLRLLTADLVLDEPDDFDTADLPALCRLVNWAGMLGARLLFSSATLPPVLVCALFEAYRTGRENFNAVNADGRSQLPVICAWFDEFTAVKAECADKKQLMQQHTLFVEKRVKALATQPVLRKASLLGVTASSKNPELIISQLASLIQQSICQLHSQHHQVAPTGQKVSIGLVRMANINPMVAVAKQLLQMAVPVDCHIHYCVYHSQYPLAVRSAIEQKLDAALTRYNTSALWQQAEISHALAQYPQGNHLFVVLATSVAEVGRDHDYDWAIAEPSSMRSLIQLAGRIQRHRQQPASSDNLLILSQNFKALKAVTNRDGKRKPAYCQPGFERDDLLLKHHDLQQILPVEYFQHISALPRISQPKLVESKLYSDLVVFEHLALFQSVFPQPEKWSSGSGDWPTDYAARWWDHHATWSAELQRRKPFRKSSPDEPYCLMLSEEDDEPVFTRINDAVWPLEYIKAENFVTESWQPTQGNHAWFTLDALSVYQQRAEQMGLTLEEVSKQFGEIRLRVKQNAEKWQYHPVLGVYGALG